MIQLPSFSNLKFLKLQLICSSISKSRFWLLVSIISRVNPAFRRISSTEFSSISEVLNPGTNSLNNLLSAGKKCHFS